MIKYRKTGGNDETVGSAEINCSVSDSEIKEKSKRKGRNEFN